MVDPVALGFRESPRTVGKLRNSAHVVMILQFNNDGSDSLEKEEAPLKISLVEAPQADIFP